MLSPYKEREKLLLEMKKPRANKHGQYALFPRKSSDHGGVLRRKRKGRGARPLAVKSSMHLVLRSTQAKGQQSFKHKKNEQKVAQIIQKFAQKYGIRILSLANVGNHLHLHLKLATRQSYKSFIRATTGAIALAVTQTSRLKKLKQKFWDLRPFTRIVQGFRDRLTLVNYIEINQLEGCGLSRPEARMAMLVRSG